MTDMHDHQIAIGQFDGTSRLLKLDLNSGTGQIVQAADFDKDQVAFGLFETGGVGTFAWICRAAGHAGRTAVIPERRALPAGRSPHAHRDQEQRARYLVPSRARWTSGVLDDLHLGLRQRRAPV